MSEFTPQPNGGIPVSPQTSAPIPPPPTYQMPPQANFSQPPYGQPGQPQFKANLNFREAGFGSAQKEKWPAVAMAFVLGALGIHKFYLGYKKEAMTMLLIALIGGALCAGLGIAVMGVIGLIEAVKYASLTEEDFQATYIQGYKGWF